MRRLRHLMRKELPELRQDPKLFGILFVAPIVQLTFLGYAATMDVKNVPMVVADADRSAASRELVTRFEGSPYFTTVGMVTSVSGETDVVDRYRTVCELLGLEVGGGGEDVGSSLAEWVRELRSRLGLPGRLSEVGVPEEGIPQLAADARGEGSTLVNPREPSEEDFVELYRKAL